MLAKSTFPGICKNKTRFLKNCSDTSFQKYKLFTVSFLFLLIFSGGVCPVESSREPLTGKSLQCRQTAHCPAPTRDQGSTGCIFSFAFFFLLFFFLSTFLCEFNPVKMLLLQQHLSETLFIGPQPKYEQSAFFFYYNKL